MRLRAGIDTRRIGVRSRALTIGVARRAIVMLALVAFTTALACASITVETAVLQDDVDFATLKTFHVLSTEDSDGNVYAPIEDAIERELTERGRTPAAPEDADMWITYRASALDRQKRRNAGDPDANSYRIVSYVEGTLAIDVFEHRAVRRIWHGQAVIDERSRERLREQADRVVDAIFAEFPGG